MREYEKMIQGEYYNARDEELVKMRLHARKLIKQFNDSEPDAIDERTQLLKQLFGKTGERIYIEPNLRVDYGCNIEVGENFFANFDCIILDVAPVKIGDNCMLAPNAKILTATHPIDAKERGVGVGYGKPIRIGNNCWIGAGAMIMPDVVLGDNVVVAAGAVVTKSFGNNVLLAGCPAQILKNL